MTRTVTIVTTATTSLRTTLAALAATALLSACASKGPAPTVYDFGPLTLQAATPASVPPALAAMAVADVTGSIALDSNRMFYRLLYADALQTRAYAHNNWSVTPLQLLSQRMKARLAQSGVKVLPSADATPGMPVLRLEADDFSHTFDSTTSSQGQITLRVSLFRNHKLVDQRTFVRSTPAASADAAGGARALAASADAVAADLVAWLATLSPALSAAASPAGSPAASR